MPSDLKYMENRKVIPNTRLLETARRDEGRFLTLILRHQDLMQDAVNSKISFKYFLIEEHAHFYGFIGDFYLHHQVLPTEQTFRSRLEGVLNDDAAISAQVISFQNRYHAHVENTEYAPLKEGLINRYIQQQLYEKVDGGQRIVDLLSATSNQSQSLSSLMSDLQTIETGTEADRHIRVSTAKESLQRVRASLEARRDNPEIAYGIMTGYQSIDSRFLGFERGKYLIVIGPPHGCKTTLMLNIAYGMARQGYTVVFVTMESSDDEIMERLVAIESEISSLTMKDGNNLRNADTMSAVIEATRRVESIVGETLILISVPQQTDWDTIRGLIDSQRLFHNIDAFWVDYLDVIERSVKIQGRADLELADISIRIQSYAKNTGMFGATAQSLNNDKIRELKKKNAFEKSDEAAFLAGGEGVGGSQKLWRDADYMLTSLPFKKGKRITIIITKARKDANSEDVFYLGWEPLTGRVYEYQSQYYVIDSVQNACKGMMLDTPPEVEIMERIEIGPNGEKIIYEIVKKDSKEVPAPAAVPATVSVEQEQPADVPVVEVPAIERRKKEMGLI